MSTESSCDESLIAADSSIESNEESTQATKTVEDGNQPMPLKEGFCLNLSMIVVVLAVLNASGLIAGLPSFLTVAVKEQPFGTFLIGLFLSVFIAFLLSDIMPRQVAVAARLPVFAFGTFWLYMAWNSLIDVNGSTVTTTNVTLILIATMLLGFCLSYHASFAGKTPTVSQYIETFVWAIIVANVVAFLVTLVIAVAFMGNVKGRIAAKVHSEVDMQEKLEYIWGACPMVESKEFCDALKIVTSR